MYVCVTFLLVPGGSWGPNSGCQAVAASYLLAEHLAGPTFFLHEVTHLSVPRSYLSWSLLSTHSNDGEDFLECL